MKNDSPIKLRVAALAAVCLVLAFCHVRQSWAQEIDSCLACHQDQALTKKDAAGKVHSLFVDREAYLKSAHAGMSCVDCHEGAQAKKHPAGGLKDVSCSDCHDDAAKKYSASPHGQLLQAGNPNAPKCYDCHTQHAVMKSDTPASSIHDDNLHATCGACHGEQAKQPFVPLVMGFVQGEEPADSFTLATFASQITTRVKGHGKDSLAYAYETKNCSNCHIDQVSHGAAGAKTPVCYSCHGQQKPGIIFGKVHKANVVLSPFLSVLLALGYIGAIAGLVFYFRPAEKKSDPPAEG